MNSILLKNFFLDLSMKTEGEESHGNLYDTMYKILLSSGHCNIRKKVITLPKKNKKRGFALALFVGM